MDFKKKVLSNGMTVLFEKRDLPIVCVAFAVRAGGINESLDEKGISHFIEHMLYKGTRKRNSKKIFSDIEKNGGELNGFTSEEVTAFWCKMPSDKLRIALDVLSDMVKNPKLDKKELGKERRVIFEEIKMRRDNPQKFVLDGIQKSLYGGSLGVDLIGTEKSLGSINRKKILTKFKRLYTSNNLILCVVGDAKFSEVVNFAEKNFSRKESKVPEENISLKNEVKFEKRLGLDQANFVFAYHVPFFDDRGVYAARILNTLSADGMSSRLFTEIREKRNLAYSINGMCDQNKRYGHNLIYVGSKKENVPVIRKLILLEFKKIAKNLKEKELNEVKKQLIGQYRLSMEDSQNQMVNLIASEIREGAEKFYDFERKIKSVRLDEVKKLASSVKEGNYSLLALIPK